MSTGKAFAGVEWPAFRAEDLRLHRDALIGQSTALKQFSGHFAVPSYFVAEVQRNLFAFSTHFRNATSNLESVFDVAK